MGDEELNFTEEESRCWADDPRNQPEKSAGLAGIVIGCVLVLVLFVAIVAATASRGSTSDGGHINVGVLLVQ